MLLPGVGSAHNAMARLRGTGLDKLIPTLKQPLLGICLGMQILFETSEEGPANGLAVIPGNVARLQFAPGLPVPHMGWNQLSQTKPDPLLDGVSSLDYVYFVHGYAVPAGNWTVGNNDGTTSSPWRWTTLRHALHPERRWPAILVNFLKAS